MRFSLFKRPHLPILALVLGGSVLFQACKDDDDDPIDIVRPDVTFYALTDNNQLLRVNAQNAQTSTMSVTITGLQSSEKLMAIDFRPATGQLYGIGSTSRIYIINPTDGVARALGTAAFTPAIDGASIGLDFNPTVDRIRLVTNKGQNLRLHPETGAVVATDGAINGASGATITTVAYTSNVAGSSATTLYDIDPTTDKLYKQDPPNNGTLVEVGSLGVDATAAGGFDITFDDKVALAALTVGGQSRLYQIDLMTGKATELGTLGNAAVIGLAIPTQPVAYAVDASNNLLIFNPENPGTPVSKAITGLQASESVVGLDMRPANGQLYALGSSSRLYTINASSGAATVVGGILTTVLFGTDFGFDFNPTVDRIRVVSNTGQNLRLHPETGAVAAVDAGLNPGSPAVTAAAYTNNFAGATTTVLYDIDSSTDKLYKQDPPNNGTLVEVGALNLNVEAANGFDISSTGGKAYALLTSGGSTKLYSINLQTGVATRTADFPAATRGLTLGLGL